MSEPLKYTIQQAIKSLELMAESCMPSWEGGGAISALNAIKGLQARVAELEEECRMLSEKCKLTDEALAKLEEANAELEENKNEAWEEVNRLGGDIAELQDVISNLS